MKTAAFITTLFSTAVICSAIPVSSLVARQEIRTGEENVRSLAQRKQQVLDLAGGKTLVLAVGMQETTDLSTNYPPGDAKPGDSTNYGIFKQNWGMLKECCSMFQGKQDPKEGEVLNSDLNADVSCLIECQNHYGFDTWIAGHRAGSCGIQNPGANQKIISDYRFGVNWIDQKVQKQVSSGSLDDTRFWADVPPVTDADTTC